MQAPAGSIRGQASGVPVLPGEAFGIALYPFQRGLVIAELSALIAEHFTPVLAYELTLGFHAPLESVR